MAPSATRGLIMSKGEGKKGLCVSSITGDFPQKLASLDIASIVVTGKYEKRNAVVFVDPNGAELMCMPELEGHTTAEMVDCLLYTSPSVWESAWGSRWDPECSSGIKKQSRRRSFLRRIV